MDDFEEALAKAAALGPSRTILGAISIVVDRKGMHTDLPGQIPHSTAIGSGN